MRNRGQEGPISGKSVDKKAAAFLSNAVLQPSVRKMDGQKRMEGREEKGMDKHTSKAEVRDEKKQSRIRLRTRDCT